MGKVDQLHSELLLRQDGQTDKVFAQLWPHMTRVYWGKLRLGRKLMTLSVCLQAGHVFPDLRQLSLEAADELVLVGRR